MPTQERHPAPGVERANTQVRNVAELVRLAARRGPEHPALVDALSGAEWSWGALDAAVSRQARRLREEGVVPGDRVMLLLSTGAAFCVALFGVLRAGCVAVPAPPSSTAGELTRIVEDCGPTALLTDQARPEVSRREDVRALVPSLPEEAGGESFPDGEDFSGEGTSPATASSDEVATRGPNTADSGIDGPSTDDSRLALLAYTSGMSAPSRAAMLSHRALLENVRQIGRLRPIPVNSADRILLAQPLFHAYGLGPGLLQVASVGATGVLLPRFDARGALDAIDKLRVTAVVGVPSMYYAWLQLPADRLRAGMSSVRLLTSGAAPLGVEAATEMRTATGLDVFEGYGLTETGPVLTTTLAGGRAKPGSVGAPLPGVDVRLLDADGRSLDSDNGATGFVAARGSNLFSGYWPDGRHGPDRDGWFRTGDVGYFDADGDLRLVDRATDLILVDGFNVYPHEVEHVLRGMDGVSEVAAVGVPGGSAGEVVKVLVVPEEGAELSESEVRDYCAGRLASFKVPRIIEFTETLPRSATGEVARRVLRDLGEADNAEASSESFGG